MPSQICILNVRILHYLAIFDGVQLKTSSLSNHRSSIVGLDAEVEAAIAGAAGVWTLCCSGTSVSCSPTPSMDHKRPIRITKTERNK